MDRGRVCEPQANTTAQTSQRLDQEVANPKSSGAANSVAAQIAKLQQTIGNRAVIRQLLRNGEREEAASAPSNGLARARTPLVIPLRSRLHAALRRRRFTSLATKTPNLRPRRQWICRTSTRLLYAWATGRLQPNGSMDSIGKTFRHVSASSMPSRSPVCTAGR